MTGTFTVSQTACGRSTGLMNAMRQDADIGWYAEQQEGVSLWNTDVPYVQR